MASCGCPGAHIRQKSRKAGPGWPCDSLLYSLGWVWLKNAKDQVLDKTFTWTVDVESDWGGRTSGALGIKEGLPAILEIFRAYNIKALFFVSSESALDNQAPLIK